MKASQAIETEAVKGPISTAADFPLMLIIEESAEVSSRISAHFEQKQFRTMAVADGEQAVLVAKEHLPDVVLLNLSIPKVDGWTVIKSLKQIDHLSHAPFLVIGGVVTTADSVKAFQVGVADVLQRSWDVEELSFRVTKSMAAAHASRRNAILEAGDANEDEKSFNGQLEDLRLTSLLSICLAERSSGVLVLVTAQGETGMLYLDDGHLLSAKAIGMRNLKNDAAVSYMIPWSKGTFKLTKMVTTGVPKEITKPIESLLLQAATIVDERTGVANLRVL